MILCCPNLIVLYPALLVMSSRRNSIQLKNFMNSFSHISLPTVGSDQSSFLVQFYKGQSASLTHMNFFLFNLILLRRIKTKTRICRKYTIQPSFGEAEQILYCIQLNTMLKMIIGGNSTSINFISCPSLSETVVMVMVCLGIVRVESFIYSTTLVSQLTRRN